MIIKSYEILKKPTSFLKNNIFLLYGENEGLKKDIKKSIIEKAQNTDIELLSFYEDDITNNQENFYNSIYASSLFAKIKIVTINNATDKISKLIENVSEKFLDNTTIIVLSDLLEKKSKLRNFFEKSKKNVCVACYLDNIRDLEIIAKTELKKNNVIMSQECLNFLIEKSNSDRNNLKNEIDKIKAFTIEKKKIELDDLKSLINFSGEYKSDSLINECLCGNMLEYKKILSEVYINTVNQTFLFRILNNKIHRLLNLKKNENKNIENLLNTFKPPIFWKEKPVIQKQLKIWDIKKLKDLIHEINEIELICKKKPQVSKIIFFNFFTKTCAKANSYS